MLTPAEALLTNQQMETSEEEVPLTFVEVDPLDENVTPPEKTTFYSNASTRAGNPDPVLVEHDQPKINGEEQEEIRTETVTRQEPEAMNPIQAAATPTPPAPQEDVPEKEDTSTPQFVSKSSDLGVAREQERTRPRKLKEVKQQLVGNASKQNGGSRRHSLVAQLDVKGTPFGNYDAAFIAAVQKRWHYLIDQSGVVTGTGMVVITFTLHSDGRISDVAEMSSTVSSLQSLLCQRAILDPAPYSPWSSELRRAVSGDTREVKFTFYYR